MIIFIVLTLVFVIFFAYRSVKKEKVKEYELKKLDDKVKNKKMYYRYNIDKYQKRREALK